MTAEPQSDQPSGIPPPIGVLPDPGIPDPPWRRLAPGMLLVEPVRELIRFIPMLIVLIFAGRVGDTGPPWGLVATGAVIALGISRYATTRYRISDALVEVRRGVFQRRHLTVPRDRIRTVDVSAHPLQRPATQHRGQRRTNPPRRRCSPDSTVAGSALRRQRCPG